MSRVKPVKSEVNSPELSVLQLGEGSNIKIRREDFVDRSVLETVYTVDSSSKRRSTNYAGRFCREAEAAISGRGGSEDMRARFSTVFGELVPDIVNHASSGPLSMKVEAGKDEVVTSLKWVQPEPVDLKAIGENRQREWMELLSDPEDRYKKFTDHHEERSQKKHELGHIGGLGAGLFLSDALSDNTLESHEVGKTEDGESIMTASYKIKRREEE